MSCLKIRDIHDYLEGSLAEERIKELVRHLISCPGCRRAVEDRGLIDRAASALAPFPVPDDFSDRVMARVTPLKIKRPAWLVVLVTATVCLAVFSLLLMAAGGSLLELVTGASHSLWGYVKTGAVYTAKAATLLTLAVKTLRPLLEAASRGLSMLTSIVHPGFQVLILVLALGIGVSFFFGVRKKLSLGD